MFTITNCDKIFTLAIASFFAMSTAHAGAATKANEAITISQTEVTKAGSNLIVSTDIDLSKLKIESNRTMTIYPMVEAGDSRQVLSPVIVNGRNRHILYSRNPQDGIYAEVKRENGKAQTVKYTQAIPYAEWMDGAMVNLYIDLCGCGGKPQDNATIPMQQVTDCQ